LRIARRTRSRRVQAPEKRDDREAGRRRQNNAEVGDLARPLDRLRNRHETHEDDCSGSQAGSVVATILRRGIDVGAVAPEARARQPHSPQRERGEHAEHRKQRSEQILSLRDTVESRDDANDEVQIASGCAQRCETEHGHQEHAQRKPLHVGCRAAVDRKASACCSKDQQDDGEHPRLDMGADELNLEHGQKHRSAQQSPCCPRLAEPGSWEEGGSDDPGSDICPILRQHC
jgi:hypothetical protein